MYNNIKSCVSVNNILSSFFHNELRCQARRQPVAYLILYVLNDLEDFMSTERHNGISIDIAYDDFAFLLKYSFYFMQTTRVSLQIMQPTSKHV